MEEQRRSRLILNVRSLIIALFIFLFHAGSAQLSENSLADKKVVLVGDIHIDKGIFTNIKASEEDLTCIKRFLAEVPFEKGLYLIEAPVSVQYYVRKYFETGDTSFLSIISNLRNEVNFIRYLKEVKKLEANDFFCYDSDTKAFKRTVVNVLFYLFFYEPYKKSFKDGDFRTAGLGSDDYNKNLIRNDKLIDSINLPENVDKINNLVWNSRHRNILNTRKLKNKFKECLEDTASLRGLKIILGDNHSYFVTLLRSYIKSVDLNLKKNSDYNKRENNTAEVINEIIRDYGKDNQVIIKCGMQHALLLDSSSIAFKMSQSYKTASVYLMYEKFKAVYPSYMNDGFMVGRPGFQLFRKNEYVFFCEPK